MQQHISDPSPTENWRDIPGWEGYYQVSDHGRVRSVDRVVDRSDGRRNRLRGKVLSLSARASGHIGVTLRRGKLTTYGVHQLVAAAFIGPRPEGMEVCHNNGDPADNRVENLRYGTRSENTRDRVDHGTHPHTRRTHCPRGHALESPNLVARDSRRGYRACLACSRAQSYIRHGYRDRSEFQQVSDSYYDDIVRDAV